MQTIKANAMPSAVLKITLVCLFFFVMGRAWADEARVVLERAIRAHGGADKLERTKRGQLKAKVEGRYLGGVSQVTWEEKFDLPRRFRRSVEGTIGGGAFSMEYVVDGTRRWGRQGQLPAQPLPKLDEPIPLERHWYAIPAQLLLLRGKDTELKFLGEEMKHGRRLAAISAQTRRATGDLYFDRATGLLARSVSPMPDFVSNKETPDKIGEYVYDDYKETQGVQYPMHIKAASPGSSLDIKIVSLEFLDKIDDGDFAKPVEAAAPQTPSPPEQPDSSSDETPVRWDMRLVVATLAVGTFMAVVWLLVRGSKTRKQETPPQ